MKIAFDMSTFHECHLGGKDEVAYNLLREFSKQGYAKDIICLALPELNDIIKKISPDYEIVNIKKKSFRVRNVISYVISDLFYGKYLCRLIKEKQIDVICFTNKFPPVVKLNTPSVVIPHDVQSCTHSFQLSKDGLVEFIIAQLTRKTLPKCSKVVAISDFDSGEMEKYLPQLSNKILRIYDPIIFNDISLSSLPKYITVINYQYQHKNVETVIKAFACVANKTDLNLILVGKYPPAINTIKKMVLELGLQDRVIFTGFVDKETKDDIIRQTRMYINASKYEGFGMTAVEMIGHGIPTIVSDVCANREVTQGLCYYYSPVDDYNKLAETIMSELTCPLSQDALMNAADKMRKSYSSDVIAREYLNFFNSMKKE